ncbi:hypothetical protein NHJ13734_000561 [Beauveria thailandica]
MSHIAPRPPQRPAHRQTLGSNPQTLDPRLELVSRLEGCIGKVLEAAKAYKSPQQQQQQQQHQHAAHQNANQMFQQRVMASRGQMGSMSDQDWLGTMMQCLNESMRTQQSSFVRNTTLDVALRTFAAGIFEALGPAYFQEPLDRYMAAASKPDSPQNTMAAHDALGRCGGILPSPPRETGGPNRSIILQRLGTQNIPPPSPTHSSPFPCSRYQIVHGSAHSASPDGAPAPQHQMRAMPILQRPLPPAHQPGRPPKRPSPTEPLHPCVQKRTCTSKALRRAAGSMGPLLSPAQARPGHGNAALKPRLCIDLWDVQQERDSQRRQAILGYGGKWYVFQCHQHRDVLLFKTAEGARHHMMTRHAMPNQHIDFLDIVQELGVEVMNCDVARAEKNNLEAVHLWNQSTSSPVAREGAAEVRVNAKVSVWEPISTTAQTVPAAACLPSASPAPSASFPRAQLESHSLVLASDVRADEEAPAEKADVIMIKKEDVDVGFSSLPAEVQPHSLMTTPRCCSAQPSEPASLLKESQGPLAHKATRTVQSPERDEPVASPEASAGKSCAVSSTAQAAPATPQHLERVPELTPNSPESSDLSEPSSLADFDSLEKQSIGRDPKVTIDGELEEGEIDESCIRVAPCPAAMSARRIASPEPSGNQKKRGISAAAAAAGGSVPCSGLPRKKLPSTPKSAQKKKKRRRTSFWSPPSRETGPSAHDQFKTRACKKCAERFYFRAQLATHMQTEHVEIITVE